MIKLLLLYVFAAIAGFISLFAAFTAQRIDSIGFLIIMVVLLCTAQIYEELIK